jgi:hypothetical protein
VTQAIRREQQRVAELSALVEQLQARSATREAPAAGGHDRRRPAGTARRESFSQ